MTDAKDLIEKFLEWLKQEGETVPVTFDPQNPTAPSPPPEPDPIVLAKDTLETGKAVLTEAADPATTVLHAGPNATSPAVVAASQATNDRVAKLEQDVSDIRGGLDQILAHLQGKTTES